MINYTASAQKGYEISKLQKIVFYHTKHNII